MRKNDSRALLRWLRCAGVVRARDAEVAGFRREALSRLARSGRIERAGRGLYVHPDAEWTERRGWVEVSKRIPRAVICLVSALRFHGLTTQAPYQVWIALPRTARRPVVAHPPLRVLRFSGTSLTAGVEEHVVEGCRIRIYGAAKTVADCFKFRRTVGLDVAVEALRDYRRVHRAGADDLWLYAKVCRVSRVMRPFLDATS